MEAAPEGGSSPLIGNRGREHSLGWKLSQSSEVSTVFYAPGKGGTEEDKGVNIPIDTAKKENFEKNGNSI